MDPDRINTRVLSAGTPKFPHAGDLNSANRGFFFKPLSHGAFESPKGIEGLKVWGFRAQWCFSVYIFGGSGGLGK